MGKRMNVLNLIAILLSYHYISNAVLHISANTTTWQCPGVCDALWKLTPRIKSGGAFQQLNTESGRNHSEMVLLTKDTTADLPTARQLFQKDTLITSPPADAQVHVLPGLHLRAQTNSLILYQDTTVTLQRVRIINALANFSRGSIDPSAGRTGGGANWSLALTSFSLSHGSLLRLVRSDLVLADCAVVRQLYDAVGAGQPQPSGAVVTQGFEPDVRVSRLLMPQLELLDVNISCNEACGSSGARTLRIAAQTDWYSALDLLNGRSADTGGCEAYILELVANISMAASPSRPPPSSLPPPPQTLPSATGRRSRQRRLMETDDGSGGDGGARSMGRVTRGTHTSSASVILKTGRDGGGNSEDVRLGAGAVTSRLHRTRQLLQTSTDNTSNDTSYIRLGVALLADVTIRGATPPTSTTSSVYLDTSFLSAVLVVHPPARLTLQDLTLTNLLSPQPGALALPIYAVDRSPQAPPIVLRNVTLVLQQDEVSYELSWLQKFSGETSMLPPAMSAWLTNEIPVVQLSTFTMSSFSMSRFNGFGMDATDLRVTSAAPPGVPLTRRPSGLGLLASSPLQPYPQIVVPSSSEGLAAALNASEGPIRQRTGMYDAYPGVPSLAAVALRSPVGAANVTFAPVAYGNVVLQRSYVLGPYANRSATLDLSRTRETWASLSSTSAAAAGEGGLSLVLRNLTVVGLDSPGRWPGDRLVRCLDLPVWAVDTPRSPSLAGEPPALSLVGGRVALSRQELALWAACYQVLTGKTINLFGSNDSSIFSVQLQDACAGLGISVFEAEANDAHSIAVSTLKGMGVMLQNVVLRDDIVPYPRYDLEELLPDPALVLPSAPTTPAVNSPPSSGRKWIIPIIVVAIIATFTATCLLLFFFRERKRDRSSRHVNTHMRQVFSKEWRESEAAMGRPQGSNYTHAYNNTNSSIPPASRGTQSRLAEGEVALEVGSSNTPTPGSKESSIRSGLMQLRQKSNRLSWLSNAVAAADGARMDPSNKQQQSNMDTVSRKSASAGMAENGHTPNGGLDSDRRSNDGRANPPSNPVEDVDTSRRRVGGVGAGVAVNGAFDGGGGEGSVTSPCDSEGQRVRSYEQESNTPPPAQYEKTYDNIISYTGMWQELREVSTKNVLVPQIGDGSSETPDVRNVDGHGCDNRSTVATNNGESSADRNNGGVTLQQKQAECGTREPTLSYQPTILPCNSGTMERQALNLRSPFEASTATEITATSSSATIAATASTTGGTRLGDSPVDSLTRRSSTNASGLPFNALTSLGRPASHVVHRRHSSALGDVSTERSTSGLAPEVETLPGGASAAAAGGSSGGGSSTPPILLPAYCAGGTAPGASAVERAGLLSRASGGSSIGGGSRSFARSNSSSSNSSSRNWVGNPQPRQVDASPPRNLAAMGNISVPAPPSGYSPARARNIEPHSAAAWPPAKPLETPVAPAVTATTQAKSPLPYTDSLTDEVYTPFAKSSVTCGVMVSSSAPSPSAVQHHRSTSKRTSGGSQVSFRGGSGGSGGSGGGGGSDVICGVGGPTGGYAIGGSPTYSTSASPSMSRANTANATTIAAVADASGSSLMPSGTAGTAGGGRTGLSKLLVGSLSNLFRADSLSLSLAQPPSAAAAGGGQDALSLGVAGGGNGGGSGIHRYVTAVPPILRGDSIGKGPIAAVGGTGTVVAGGAWRQGVGAGGDRRNRTGGGNAANGGGGGGGGVGGSLGTALSELTADLESRLNENQLVIQQALGAGAFGTVYKALWKGLQVAVKTMTLTSDAVTQGRHAALMEAALSKSIFHAHVVTTYTCDLKPMHVDSRRAGAMTGLTIMNETEVIQEWRLYIVQEFCDAGSLRHAIETRSFLNPTTGVPQLEWVLQMAREIAAGMQYLHEHSIIHGDLNPANVLLKREDGSALGYTAKIADFGLSVHMNAEQSHVSNTKRGTPFYTAPEVTNAGNLTRFADVFSYGVVLWELYSSRSCWMYGPTGRLVHVRGFPYLPTSCPRPFASLVAACMQPAHKQRPTFKSIGLALEAMLRELEHFYSSSNNCTYTSNTQVHYNQREGLVGAPYISQPSGTQTLAVTTAFQPTPFVEPSNPLNTLRGTSASAATTAWTVTPATGSQPPGNSNQPPNYLQPPQPVAPHGNNAPSVGDTNGVLPHSCSAPVQIAPHTILTTSPGKPYTLSPAPAPFSNSSNGATSGGGGGGSGGAGAGGNLSAHAAASSASNSGCGATAPSGVHGLVDAGDASWGPPSVPSLASTGSLLPLGRSSSSTSSGVASAGGHPKGATTSGTYGISSAQSAVGIVHVAGGRAASSPHGGLSSDVMTQAEAVAAACDPCMATGVVGAAGGLQLPPNRETRCAAGGNANGNDTLPSACTLMAGAAAASPSLPLPPSLAVSALDAEATTDTDTTSTGQRTVLAATAATADPAAPHSPSYGQGACQTDSTLSMNVASVQVHDEEMNGTTSSSSSDAANVAAVSALGSEALPMQGHTSKCPTLASVSLGPSTLGDDASVARTLPDDGPMGQSSPSSSPQGKSRQTDLWVSAGSGDDTSVISICDRNGGGTGIGAIVDGPLAGVMRAFEIPTEPTRFGRPDLPTVPEVDDEPTSGTSLTHGSTVTSVPVDDDERHAVQAVAMVPFTLEAVLAVRDEHIDHGYCISQTVKPGSDQGPSRSPSLTEDAQQRVDPLTIDTKTDLVTVSSDGRQDCMTSIPADELDSSRRIAPIHVALSEQPAFPQGSLLQAVLPGPVPGGAVGPVANGLTPGTVHQTSADAAFSGQLLEAQMDFPRNMPSPFARPSLAADTPVSRADPPLAAPTPIPLWQPQTGLPLSATHTALPVVSYTGAALAACQGACAAGAITVPPSPPPVSSSPDFSRPNLEKLAAATGADDNAGPKSTAPGVTAANHSMGDGNSSFPGFANPRPLLAAQSTAVVISALNLDPDLPRFARATMRRGHDPDDYTPDLPGPTTSSVITATTPLPPPPSAPLSAGFVSYMGPLSYTGPASQVAGGSLACGGVNGGVFGSPVHSSLNSTAAMAPNGSGVGVAPTIATSMWDINATPSPISSSPLGMPPVQKMPSGPISMPVGYVWNVIKSLGSGGGPQAGGGDMSWQSTRASPDARRVAEYDSSTATGGRRSHPGGAPSSWLGLDVPYPGNRTDLTGLSLLGPQSYNAAGTSAAPPPRFQRDSMRTLEASGGPMEAGDSGGDNRATAAFTKSLPGERTANTAGGVPGLFRALRSAVTGGIGDHKTHPSTTAAPSPPTQLMSPITNPCGPQDDPNSTFPSVRYAHITARLGPNEAAPATDRQSPSSRPAGVAFQRPGLSHGSVANDVNERFPEDFSAVRSLAACDRVEPASGDRLHIGGSSFDEALRLGKCSLSTVPESASSFSKTSMVRSSAGGGVGAGAGGEG